MLIVLVIVTYLVPRLIALDRLVTVDEGFWLGRSANFNQALMSGEFASTYQFAHPGVPTMWAGAIAYRVVVPDYATAYPEQIDYVLDAHRVLRDLGRDPLSILVAGRVVKLLMQTAFLALGFWLARPVFGTLTAVVGTLLLAFDPFLIGHDRLLHVDSLFAMAAFVSLLALLRALRTGIATRYLIISGVFAAFAWLSRTPGVVLVAVVALVLLVAVWHCHRGRPLTSRAARTVRGVVRPLAIWLAVASATTFTAWPALWVSPATVARRMFSWSLAAASDGHEYASFFYGTVASGDPGLLFYPVTLLWRLTPFTLLGLLVAGLGLGFRWRTLVPRALAAPVLLLAGYALLYLAGMSLGAKKFDRYLLPVYPALDFIAAVGIVGIARLIVGLRTQDSGLTAFHRGADLLRLSFRAAARNLSFMGHARRATRDFSRCARNDSGVDRLNLTATHIRTWFGNRLPLAQHWARGWGGEGRSGPRFPRLGIFARWAGLRHALAGLAVAAVVAGQIASALTVAPYYLPYFNPLLGGVAGAEDALLLGWGEGLDQVAGFILSQPEGEHATIRGSNQRNTLLYYLPSTVTVPPSQFHSGMAGIVEWAETDYFVAYVTQGQRGLSRSSAHVTTYPPVHTVSFGGIPFARTYDLHTIPPPAWMVDHPCAFAFGDGVQLVAYEDEAIGLSDANNRELTLHFTSLPATEARYLVRVDLQPLDPDLKPMSSTTMLWPASETGLLSEVDFAFRFPRKRTLNSYTLLVTVLDPATNQPIPATRVTDGIDRPRALVPRCS